MTDTMKDGERGKPILFSAPMIRALIAGTKTQTRRVLKEQCHTLQPARISLTPGGRPTYEWRSIYGRHLDYVAGLKNVGDRLWVREAWRTDAAFDHVAPRNLDVATPYRFEADGRWVDPYEIGDLSPGRLRASMHMPRWASRLTLIVTGVRVQRLQDISNDDCIAEGVPAHPNPNAPRTGPAIDAFAREHGLISHYGAEYRRIWNAINGAGSWAANPWIAAYSFEVHHQNIDALPLPAARDAAKEVG